MTNRELATLELCASEENLAAFEVTPTGWPKIRLHDLNNSVTLDLWAFEEIAGWVAAQKDAHKDLLQEKV